MVNSLGSNRPFRRSVAVFDRALRLVEWDDGFIAEFAAARDLIAVGVGLADLHAKVEILEPAIVSDLEMEYETPAGRLVHVQQIVTPSGSLCRMASDVTDERPRRGGPGVHRVDSPATVTETAISLRREADGHFIFPPVTDDVKRLFGVPLDFDATDTMSIYSRIEQSPEEIAVYTRAMENSIRDMTVLTVDFRTYGVDGVLRWIRSTETPVREADGAIEWTGTLRDVTREKFAEDQVELLRSVVIQASDAIGIFETDVRPPGPTPSEGGSTILYVNPAFERLWGFTLDELAGKRTGMLSLGLIESDMATLIWGALESGDTRSFELRFHRRDGEPFWVEARFAVVQRFADRNARWVMVLRDIGDRRLVQTQLMTAKEAAEAAAEELALSQRHLARAQRIAAIGSAEIDLRTGRVAWSEETYRIFGFEPGSCVPGTDLFLSLIHPDDRGRIAGLAAEMTEAGYEECRIVRPDGAVRVVEIESEVVRDEVGHPVFYTGVFRDVTEQREAARREAELELQLHHSQKLEALGTLAGGIAHDLNNTLVPIMALTKMTAVRLASGSRERANLDIVYRSSEHARDLVAQILTFSRKSTPASQVISLAAVVREALQMLRASLPSNVRIVDDIATDGQIFGDPTQINQVIINLVTNAAHAIGDLQGRVTLALTEDRETQPETTSVRLTISDTGCGMDQRTLGRMFEPFFTTKGVGEGTGLGLSIVHGIVANHHGRISVSSEIGAGTVFTIQIPCLGPGRSAGLAVESAGATPG